MGLKDSKTVFQRSIQKSDAQGNHGGAGGTRILLESASAREMPGLTLPTNRQEKKA